MLAAARDPSMASVVDASWADKSPISPNVRCEPGAPYAWPRRLLCSIAQALSSLPELGLTGFLVGPTKRPALDAMSRLVRIASRFASGKPGLSRAPARLRFDNPKIHAWLDLGQCSIRRPSIRLALPDLTISRISVRQAGAFRSSGTQSAGWTPCR